MSDVRALLQNPEQLLSEMGIPAGKLEGEGWEDLLEVAAVFKIPRAEEAGSKLAILEGCLGE